MHNHDDNNSSMMWMMMACCLLLSIIFIIAFSGRGIGLPTWLVLGIVAVFAGFHIWGMRKSHGGGQQPPEETKPEAGTVDHSNHSHH